MTARLRAKNRERVLRLIEAAGQQGVSTEALSAQAGMTPRAVVSLCRELQQGQIVVPQHRRDRLAVRLDEHGEKVAAVVMASALRLPPPQ